VKNVRDVDFDGSLFKAARLKNGATQDRFADMLGISRNYVYMLENGLRSPGKKLLKRISFCTDIPARNFIDPQSAFRDAPDDPGKANCFLDLTNRVNRERHEKHVYKDRTGELEKLTEHLMALNALLFQANRVYRQEITLQR
jgi:transcriptional regulator with XRE-family HTH domain